MAVITNQSGTSSNPLIFGGVGLGKTHIAHAIGVKLTCINNFIHFS
jgi:chromosomal replication initiation ATPase DnaA